jgi:hypothetical protein
MIALVVKNIPIKIRGLSLKRHLRENEKSALQPYILQSRFAKLMRNFTSIIHIRSKKQNSPKKYIDSAHA